MKEYVKPQLSVEYVTADTTISSVCIDCPAGADCVNAQLELGPYINKDGTTIWCNYGTPGIEC